MRDIVRETVIDLAALIAGTARVVWRHWPVLLAIAFTGIGVHQAIRAAAAEVSETDGTLGFVVLIAAPLAMLSALIVMLRVASGPGKVGVIGHVGGLLVPFLAAYEAQGDFGDVISDYLYHTWLHGSEDSIPTRLTVTMAVVVVTAMIARNLLVRAEQRFSDRWRWLGFPAAYLEMLWLTVVVLAVGAVTDTGVDWLGQRRVAALGQEWWAGALELLGPLKAVAELVQTGIGAVLGASMAVFLHPLAWLAVTAILLGELRQSGGGDEASGPRDGDAAPAEAGTSPEGTGEEGTGEEGTAQASRSTARILVDRGEEFVRNSFIDRFGPLYQTVQQVRRTGLVAVLTFCLLFLAARATHRGLWELERLVIGPMELHHGGWFELSAVLSDVNDAITLMMTTAVLAVAAPIVLRQARHSARRAPRPEPDGSAEPGSEEPGQAGQDADAGTVSAR